MNQAPHLGFGEALRVPFHVRRRAIPDDREHLAGTRPEDPRGIGEVGRLSAGAGAAAVAFSFDAMAAGAQTLVRPSSCRSRLSGIGERTGEARRVGVAALPRTGRAEATLLW